MSFLGRVVRVISHWFGDAEEHASLEPDDETRLRRVFRSWIEEMTEKNTLPQTCVAVYIGLTAEGPTYLAYLVGSSEYDQYRDEWICRRDFAPTEAWELDTGVSIDVPGSEVVDIIVDEVLEILDTKANTLLHQAPHVSAGFEYTQNIT